MKNQERIQAASKIDAYNEYSQLDPLQRGNSILRLSKKS